MNILETQDLSLSFNGKKIINGLNIAFAEGQIHAIVGPNGAGKSTFASILMGLSGYRDIDGDVLFQGHSLKATPVDQRAQQGITMAWQEPARYEGLLVKNFIRAAAVDKTPARTEEALTLVGLDPNEYLHRAVDKTLSGGERKKIELASILVMRPRVVLLDEPDSGIDVESLTRIFDAIKVLKEQGTTVILITHSLTVLNQAQYAFLMCCGEIVDQGPIEKIRPYFENKCMICHHKHDLSLGGGKK